MKMMQPAHGHERKMQHLNRLPRRSEQPNDLPENRVDHNIKVKSNATSSMGLQESNSNNSANPCISGLHQHSSASDSSGDRGGDYPDSRYECAICIHWLNEPVLTSCGHRFCKTCLNDWLVNHNQCCPLDNKQLSTEHDIFPDNYTRREIEQIKHKCPNSPLGCAVVASPIEVDLHQPSCPYRRVPEEKCPFASVKCDFVSYSKSISLEEHLKADMQPHMQLILEAFQQNSVAAWQPQKSRKPVAEANGHFTTPSQQTDEEIVQAMYQRIVVLEQKNREQDARLENITKQLNSSHLVDARYSNGTIIWHIDQVHSLIQRLRDNSNERIYSHECYTSPYGYKFCARLNIQPHKLNMLSLHVHLMQSENDFHLDWPFKGRIRLSMVHPTDASQSQRDTIMTKPILAFQQPQERISIRGFGFLEYANITDIMNLGFCANDRLLIKIEINIV